MTYSPRVEHAIKTAAWLHRDQVRKGRVAYPYITHLMSLALMLRDYTDDEDIIIGALLHDSLEDTSYTEEQLGEDFGAHVATMVKGVSEWTGNAQDRPPLPERRARYIEALRNAPYESILISAADKIHNLRSMIAEYAGREEDFARDFGNVEDRIAFYDSIAALIRDRLQNHPLVSIFDDVLTEFAVFARRGI